ncbi:MAG: thiamine phosphate synthase [Gemmatimonadota bacterium]|nr:thiamine phosphate synthase [Gemmatimonadota bacterium]MDE2677298.1 thiamine phosphate synthase [Gemmatimonadota bacterium]
MSIQVQEPYGLARRLRLIAITDSGLAAPRRVVDVVEAALRAGAPAVQLRDKVLPPRDLLPLARRLRALTGAAGALFFVNDRLDLALAAGADGVHLGPDDLPVAAARRIAPPGFLIGHSADDPDAARAAVAAGADYIGSGAVFPTSTKADAGAAIGVRRLGEVARCVDVPVVAIGGVTVRNAPRVFAAGAAGCAVVSAVMGAPDPGRAVRGFLRAGAARPTP